MLQLDDQISAVRKSTYFDQAWYCEQYPDVALSGVDPAWHYVRIGAVVGRDPGPAFSTKGYLGRYGDVARKR